MNNKITRTNIKIEDWARKNHYNFYKNFPDPNFNICFSMDISAAYQFAKRNDLSPFLVLMYLSSQACNSVEAFRIRLDEHQQPYVLNRVEPSVTVAKKDGIFNFCNMKHQDSFASFVEINSKLVDESLAAEPLAEIDNKDNQIFYSITPWLAFTGYKHAKGEGFLDTPRIVFGKFDSVNDKVTMPVSIELHHAIADAIDIARYQERFAEHMAKLA